MNGYNIDFAVSATISEATVAEMIQATVEKQTGRKVKKVAFITKEVSDWADRHSSYVFDGCLVEFEKAPV